MAIKHFKLYSSPDSRCFCNGEYQEGVCLLYKDLADNWMVEERVFNPDTLVVDKVLRPIGDVLSYACPKCRRIALLITSGAKLDALLSVVHDFLSLIKYESVAIVNGCAGCDTITEDDEKTKMVNDIIEDIKLIYTYIDPAYVYRTTLELEKQNGKSK